MNPINLYRERISKTSLSPYLSYAQGWTMRIWREERVDSTTLYIPGRCKTDDDVHNAIQRFVQLPASMLDVAKGILELPRVNAVEIIDMAGFGEVLYKDWP